MDEFHLETVTVDYFRELGYEYIHGPIIAPDGEAPEREDYAQVVLTRRLRDAMVFINGLPLGVIELKNPAEEKATIRHAFNQLQTYKTDIPSLFVFNEALVISDGYGAKAGTLTSGWDRFQPWRTINGDALAPKGSVQLEVLVKGIFERQRFLDYGLNFVTFEDDGRSIAKKAAAYHQYWAVNKAVDCTVEASSPDGDQRIGVVWHTQGSGKSLSMAFYSGKIVKHEAMENPTLVVITDRNDLDDQLFGTFSTNSEMTDDERVRNLQRKLYRKAKEEERYRFYVLYDKVCLPYVVREAYRRVKANHGAPGVDGVSFSDLEADGEGEFLDTIRKELEERTYRPSPVKRKLIPKANGKMRPLGIPTLPGSGSPDGVQDDH